MKSCRGLDPGHAAEAVDVERVSELEHGEAPDLDVAADRRGAVAAIVPRRLDAPLVGREWRSRNCGTH
jgi:hypothetical protein